MIAPLVPCLLQSLAVPSLCIAQEPSATLKQADADYRAGVAALTTTILNGALAGFLRRSSIWRPRRSRGTARWALFWCGCGHDQWGEFLSWRRRCRSSPPTPSPRPKNRAKTHGEQGERPRRSRGLRAPRRPHMHRIESLPAAVLAAYARALAANRQFPAAVSHMKRGDCGRPERMRSGTTSLAHSMRSIRIGPMRAIRSRRRSNSIPTWRWLT